MHALPGRCDLEEPSLTPTESLALLRENASRLAALTDGLPAERLHRAPGPDEWSPNDVLAHIRACCDVWGGNIERILAEEHPTFAGTNPRTWMKRTDYPTWQFEAAARAFAAQREGLLETLHRVDPCRLATHRDGHVLRPGQRADASVLRLAARQARAHARAADSSGRWVEPASSMSRASQPTASSWAAVSSRAPPRRSIHESGGGR